MQSLKFSLCTFINAMNDIIIVIIRTNVHCFIIKISIQRNLTLVDRDKYCFHLFTKSGEENVKVVYLVLTTKRTLQTTQKMVYLELF